MIQKIFSEKAIVLILSRVWMRLVLLLGNFFLIHLWGEEVFGTFSGILGQWGFLIALTSFGLEKFSLTILPRAHRSQGTLLVVLIVIQLTYGMLAGMLVLGYFFSTSDLDIELGIYLALFNISTGIFYTLQYTSRGQGLIHLEYMSSIFFGVGVLFILAVTFLKDWEPLQFACAENIILFLINVILLGKNLSRKFRSLHFSQIKKLFLIVWKNSFFMGINNLVGSITISTVYWVMIFMATKKEISYFHLSLASCTLLFAFAQYVMRIYFPEISQWVKKLNPDEFFRFLKQVFKISLAAEFIGIAAGGALFLSVKWVTNEIHLPGYTPVLSLALILSLFFVCTDYFVALCEMRGRKFIVIATLALIMGYILTGILSVLFIGFAGPVGGVASMLLGELAAVCFIYGYIRYDYSKPHVVADINST